MINYGFLMGSPVDLATVTLSQPSVFHQARIEIERALDAMAAALGLLSTAEIIAALCFLGFIGGVGAVVAIAKSRVRQHDTSVSRPMNTVDPHRLAA